jgi:hypothetical protein
VQIHAFVPAGRVQLQGPVVNALGVPQTELHLPPLQADQVHQIETQILLCISALNDGTERDPHFYIKVHDGGGELRCRAEQMFIWDDVPDREIKWRVFDLHLPVYVFGAGQYHFGVYANDDDEPHRALSSFQWPIILDAPGQLPFLQQPPPPNN